MKPIANYRGVSENDQREVAGNYLANSPALLQDIRRRITEDDLFEPFKGTVTQEDRTAIATDRKAVEETLAVANLEAIIRRYGRPPLLVVDDAVVFDPPLLDFPPGTEESIKRIQSCVESVGRVEFVNYSMQWGGTGWVIGHRGSRRTIATNRHVAEEVARRRSNGSGYFLRQPVTGNRYGMKIDFEEEVFSDPSQAIEFSVVDIVYLADTTNADVAFLEIDGTNLPAPLELADSEAAVGNLVGLIGYPAFDPKRNDEDDMARYFRDVYEVKRFAPGVVSQAISGAAALQHDCTSLGGNSGSPLVRLSDGKVVGLHYAGLYGAYNSAVGVDTLKSLLQGERPVSVLVSGSRQESRGDGSHAPDEFAGRDGYDPEFLGDGLSAPWPELPDDIVSTLVQPTDAEETRPHEVRYTHFGILFSSERRQAVMTAVNIDGSRSVRIKRSDDRWFHDLRLPREVQLSKDDYDDPDIDRGHMVRREDPNWDSRVAQQANDDTFHYTNAAVQHSGLNRSSRQWYGLEEYILNSARTEGFKACVFTGPVMRDDDSEIKDGVVAPNEFWKLVAMIDADKGTLHATAYVLSQGQFIRDLMEGRLIPEAQEGFVYGEYRTFQVAIADLGALTGYNFSAYVAGDPLARLDEVAAALDGGDPVYVALDDPSQIVL